MVMDRQAPQTVEKGSVKARILGYMLEFVEQKHNVLTFGVNAVEDIFEGKIIDRPGLLDLLKQLLDLWVVATTGQLSQQPVP